MASDSNTLASVLLAHQGPFWDGIHSRCGCRRILLGAQEWAEHLQEVLRSVPGIEIVELPEPFVTTTNTAGWATVPAVSRNVGYVLMDRPSALTPDDAREVAAALIAAARAAETGADHE